MDGTILIYGATGYTGKLIARAAGSCGVRPVLAGRSYEKVMALAKPLGLSGRAFDLASPTGIDEALRDVSAVLCVAGPFSATARPMAEACIRNKVHYLDITGEIDVFEALAARDAEAKRQGVVLLPGVGFWAKGRWTRGWMQCLMVLGTFAVGLALHSVTICRAARPKP